MGKDVVVHVAIYRQNKPTLNKCSKFFYNLYRGIIISSASTLVLVHLSLLKPSENKYATKYKHHHQFVKSSPTCNNRGTNFVQHFSFYFASSSNGTFTPMIVRLNFILAVLTLLFNEAQSGKYIIQKKYKTLK